MTERHWPVSSADEGARLDKFLAAADRLGSRGRASTAIEKGKVFLNEVEVAAHGLPTRLKAGDVIRYWEDRPGSARATAKRRSRPGELDIVYEDDALVVINKPAGLLTVPLERREDATSVEQELQHYLRAQGKRKPLVVHRIDRDTSGLVAFAKRTDAYASLRGQFRRHEPERIYLAVVSGCPEPARGRWRDHLVWDSRALIQKETHPRDPRGQEAVCDYRVVERFGSAALIEVRLVTGRRNQIRLQARLRGHTLIGEQRYVWGRGDDENAISFGRQALHAHRLSIQHPDTGEILSWEVPLPADMAALVEGLRAETEKNGDERPKVRVRGRGKAV